MIWIYLILITLCWVGVAFGLALPFCKAKEKRIDNQIEIIRELADRGAPQELIDEEIEKLENMLRGSDASI